MTEATLSPTDARLLTALQNIQTSFGKDADLVRAGAAEHGVEVIEAGMADAPSLGNYNPRIPTGTPEEVALIKHAKSLNCICMDYRQSGEVVEQLHLNVGAGQDLLFANAGGAAQPSTDRQALLVEFLLAAMAVNPGLKLRLGIHNEVCGGANYFSNGKMKQLRNQPEGQQAERAAMLEFLKATYEALLAGGVVPSSIEQYLSVIGSDHKLAKLERIY